MEIRESYIEIGDLVRFSLPEIIDSDGARDIRIYYVQGKKFLPSGLVRYTLEDTGYGDHRYGLIAPPGTADYTSADDDTKRKYCFTANASEEMSNGDNPYRIF